MRTTSGARGSDGGPVDSGPPPRETTADRIKDYILGAGLRPGDLLPTEVELCERLGVSRSNVREAIRRLSTLDIVEVRHGHGTFVGRMSLDALVESLVFRGVLSPGDDLRALREVIDLRKTLDLAMAERIVDVFRGTSDPDLHELVEQMVEIASGGATFPRQDRDFHTRLLSRLDNSLVGQLVGAFWDVHTAVVPRLGVSVAADLVRTARTHGEMLGAAEDGDVERFRLAVHAHYEPIERALPGGGA